MKLRSKSSEELREQAEPLHKKELNIGKELKNDVVDFAMPTVGLAAGGTKGLIAGSSLAAAHIVGRDLKAVKKRRNAELAEEELMRRGEKIPKPVSYKENVPTKGGMVLRAGIGAFGTHQGYRIGKNIGENLARSKNLKEFKDVLKNPEKYTNSPVKKSLFKAMDERLNDAQKEVAMNRVIASGNGERLAKRAERYKKVGAAAIAIPTAALTAYGLYDAKRQRDSFKKRSDYYKKQNKKK